jgi:hypothetical protein
LLRVEPNFQNRCAIRSVYDGRYRFSRYFGQTDFNRPTTWEELTSKNDIELYDLETDPEEIDNLATDRRRHGDLVMTMNAKLNARIDEEVGVDDGSRCATASGTSRVRRIASGPILTFASVSAGSFCEC